MSESDLYKAIVMLCQDYGITTADTYDAIQHVIATIVLEDEEDEELPNTCLNNVDGHWYVITYGRAPYSIHATDCITCQEA